MMIEERQRRILEALLENPQHNVRSLAALLYVSEPTVRRDFTELHQKGLLTKVYGGAIVNAGSADREIPFVLRENEKSRVKTSLGAAAAKLVRDGMVLMLDGSTSAYHLVPYLTHFSDLIVITSGAKTAVALAEANIRTFCTGGQMRIHSFSYVGEQAQAFVRNLNADLLFFSCRGVSKDGRMSDLSMEEANLRRVMFGCCKRKYLLCDSSKFGKTYFYNMGSVAELDGVLCEKSLPPEIAAFFSKEKHSATHF